MGYPDIQTISPCVNKEWQSIYYQEKAAEKKKILNLNCQEHNLQQLLYTWLQKHKIIPKILSWI